MVLGGDSSAFARARYGVHLFHQNRAPVVVLSVGHPGNNKSCLPSAQRVLDVVQQLGLSSDAMIIAYGAKSTYDEAISLRRLAQQHDWDSLIVVTDAFHAYRAGLTFRSALPDKAVSVSVAPNPKYDPHCWWQTRDSLIYVFSEMFKLAYYWVRYGIAPVDVGRLKRGMNR